MVRVVAMNTRGKPTPQAARRAWLRRQASHIVAQLPEDIDDALYVLAEARRFVEEFLRDNHRPQAVQRVDEDQEED